MKADAENRDDDDDWRKLDYWRELRWDEWNESFEPAFRFSSDSDWAKIYAAMHPVCKGLNSKQARKLLESRIDAWICISTRPWHTSVTCYKILKALVSLQKAMGSSYIGKILIDRQFLREINWLGHQALATKGEAEGGTRYSKNHGRDMLVNTLIRTWAGSGGNVTRNSAGGKTKAGALIRFMMEVTETLERTGFEIGLTPDIADKQIRKYRKFIQKQYMAKTFDEALKNKQEWGAGRRKSLKNKEIIGGQNLSV